MSEDEIDWHEVEMDQMEQDAHEDALGDLRGQIAQLARERDEARFWFVSAFWLVTGEMEGTPYWCKDLLPMREYAASLEPPKSHQPTGLNPNP